MTARLTTFLGFDSHEPSNNSPQDDYYIPYKPPDAHGFPSSLNINSDMGSRQYSLSSTMPMNNNIGIGQSPQPVHQPSQVPHSRRATLSSLFSAAAKSKQLSRPNSIKHSPSVSRSNSLHSHSSASRDIRHKPSHSSDLFLYEYSHTPEAHAPLLPPPLSPDSQTLPKSEFPHINSADLLRTRSLRDGQPPSYSLKNQHDVQSPIRDISQPRPHPYANAIPLQSSFSDPRTAPLPPSNSTSPPFYSRTHVPLFDSSPESSSPPLNSKYPHMNLPPKTLKSSLSTPNLRSAHTVRRKSSRLDGLTAKWLGAESWCDTFFFPRPRLKGRPISISPPLSPDSQSNPVLQSRVLAYSQSHGHLRQARVEESYPSVYRSEQPNPGLLVQPSSLPSRPKSFAQDDLALPSPAPSLATVLQQGELLLNQRHKWNNIASSSLGNKHARTLSRARSKSLNTRSKDKDTKDHALTYLAARSLLGDQHTHVTLKQHPTHFPQKLAKQIHVASSEHRSSSDVCHSSKSHSRNGSWARNVIRACIDPELSPGTERRNALERALGNEETKKIVVPDPTLESSRLSVVSPLSPAPLRYAFQGNHETTRRDLTAHFEEQEEPLVLPESNNLDPSPNSSDSPEPSDQYMGIALTTPPLLNPEDPDAGKEISFLSSHPYASAGGLYPPQSRSTQGHKKTASVGSDYAGAHPIMSHPPQICYPHHRPSPSYQARFSSHPYAFAGHPRDSYISDSKVIPMIRPDSDIPLSEKMWVALGPTDNVAREILPAEIASYSPFPGPLDTLGPERDKDIQVVANSHAGDSDVGTSESNKFSTRSIEDDTGDITYSSRSGTQFLQRANSRKAAPPPLVVSDVEGQASHSHRPLAAQDENPRQTNHILPIINHDIAPHPHIGIPTSTQVVSNSTFGTLQPLDVIRNSPPGNPGSGSSPSSQDPCSTTMTSRASSPPRPLGSVDDLVEFEDLFYQPKMLTQPLMQSLGRSTQMHNSFSAGMLPPKSKSTSPVGPAEHSEWDNERLHNPSPEFLTSVLDSVHENEDPSFGHGYVNSSTPFHLEDPDSPFPDEERLARPVMVPFRSTSTLPEDVDLESSRASSPEDETVFFRLGQVEALATPSPDTIPHRPTSSVGEMSFAIPERYRPFEEFASPRNPYNSGLPSSYAGSILPSHYDPRTPQDSAHSTTLHPTSAALRSSLDDAACRRSYMTTSDASRMSGLSDFPVPPLHIPFNPQQQGFAGEGPSSIIESYFDGPPGAGNEQLANLPPPTKKPPSPIAPSIESRMTFGPRGFD